MSKVFAVCGRPKIDPEQTMIMRLFDTHDAAIAHALSANMDHWDDVFVKEVAHPLPRADDHDAPPPWSEEWVSTFTYLRDANGKRVVSLFGSEQRRVKIIDTLDAAGLIAKEPFSARAAPSPKGEAA